jgi:hypothetical protein
MVEDLPKLRERAARYRLLGEEIRVSVVQIAHCAPRETLLQLAASYDLLAEHMDREARSGRPAKGTPSLMALLKGRLKVDGGTLAVATTPRPSE